METDREPISEGFDEHYEVLRVELRNADVNDCTQRDSRELGVVG